MTTDEIIDLAHKAGAGQHEARAVVTIKWMENFAALVAAAKDAEHQQTLALQQRSYEREIEIEVEAEREACAKLADAEASIEGIAQRISAAIRARSNT